MDFQAIEGGSGCCIAEEGFEPNMAQMLLYNNIESFKNDGDINALNSSSDESDSEFFFRYRKRGL